MSNSEIIEQIRALPTKEKRKLDRDKIGALMKQMTSDEIEELSRAIGYPVFVRVCMGELGYLFVMLQDGAAAAIIDKEGRILLQSRADRDLWGLPGGCQEVGERFEDVVIREVKEETNLDVKEEDLKLISVVSGKSRKNSYPHGDIVYNNTVFYCIENYSGKLKWNEESKDMKFYDLDNLPNNLHDADLIEIYKDYVKKQKDN